MKKSEPEDEEGCVSSVHFTLCDVRVYTHYQYLPLMTKEYRLEMVSM